jgi:NifU-like protein involved in Fe-S cluster formation
MNVPLYTTEILRLAASLSEPMALEREDGRAEMRSPTCGSTIAASVMVEDGRIVAISQRVHACAFGQASAALAERSAIGQDKESVSKALDELADWLDGTADSPGTWPGLDALAPARSRKGRHGAILLPVRALLAALESAQ